MHGSLLETVPGGLCSVFYPDRNNCNVCTVSKQIQLWSFFLATLLCFQLFYLSFTYSGIWKGSTGTCGGPLLDLPLYLEIDNLFKCRWM